MRIRVLMITCNRPRYTALALEHLCATLPEQAVLTIWDNASDRETCDVVRRFESHPRVAQVVWNRTNDKLHKPTNWFWERAEDAELLSKVDDDALMPERWIETLEQCHRDVSEAGILGTWRFPDEDYRDDLARRKIQAFGPHRVMRNCWVEGSGYLMKRAVLNDLGPLREGESFTAYCTRAAQRGYINGWYFPFLYQEHMDDPRAPHTGLKTEDDFLRARPLTAVNFNCKSREQWIQLNREFALSLQQCSFDPADYIGLRAAIRQKICRLLGKRYTPLA